MSSQYDVWAVTPAPNDALLRAAAAIGGAGALTLLTQETSVNGCGYKILFTISGSDTIAFTITGIKVGDKTGAVTTETVSIAAGTTGTSTNYYCVVQSITASAGTAGGNTVKIGTTGSLALPRTRIKGLYYVASASAGTVQVNVNGTSGTLVLQINTPALATATSTLYMAAEGILTGRSSGTTDFAVVTLTNVSFVTLICG